MLKKPFNIYSIDLVSPTWHLVHTYSPCFNERFITIPPTYLLKGTIITLVSRDMVGCIFLQAKNRLDDLVYEIRLVEGNPSPVDVGSLSHYLQGFIHLRWLGMGFGISEPSTLSAQGSRFNLGKTLYRFTPWKIQLTTLPETDSLHPKNGWFPIGTSFSRGLFSGAMLVSGKVYFDVVSDHVTIF